MFKIQREKNDPARPVDPQSFRAREDESNNAKQAEVVLEEEEELPSSRGWL